MTIKFEDAIRLAKQHRACSKEIAIIKKCSSLEEFYKLPNAGYYLYWYARHVISGRDTAIESRLLEIDRGYDLYCYARHVIHGRDPAIEARLLEVGTGDDLRWYAYNIIRGDWPEAGIKLIDKNGVFVGFDLNQK